jgi:hypothetical protein
VGGDSALGSDAGPTSVAGCSCTLVKPSSPVDPVSVLPAVANIELKGITSLARC